MLGWKSKKIRRKVVSSLAGECLAMVATMGELVYTQAILMQMLGKQVEKVPKIVVMDF